MRKAWHVVLMLGLLAACSKTEPVVAVASAPASEAKPTFVNKVWRVSESTGMSPGQLVVFLSDGTLVLASGNAEPALGTWRTEKGALTMIEEGIAYPTDILSLSPAEFRIRSHNPGGNVETRFVPAEGGVSGKN